MRPLSLTLRLVINLTIGHFLMLVWIFVGRGIAGGVLMVQFFLLFIVMYEFFVFVLQSFIFSRLLGIYLEECYYSIKSTAVLRSVSCF